MSDGSGSLEVEHSDVECFEALPDDTVEAIGSTESAIRKIIRENQETTDVVKYIRFTNVPPAIADKFSLRRTRQILDGAVQYKIYNMGLDESIRPLGSETIQGVFCRKEADASFGPTQPIPGRNPKRPAVIVKVGVLETYRKLRADAEWWLTNSRGDVKLVIIVSISRETPDIKFETVASDPTVNYVLKIRQTITASRDANKPDSQITSRLNTTLNYHLIG
ncbi:uncharacterized protein N7525_001730 [Penicillium rubens]|uniref:uncharacterized protein n=1 Tax=Penicillium rubens TaxID=1108849 RepID=UPI002A5A895E|nr:uncharacterized protein N7525_001730 [Penicillium rubens]KAJ5843989.1 hypothetical protein N7525_001730 [Penicillium rubens]